MSQLTVSTQGSEKQEVGQLCIHYFVHYKKCQMFITMIRHSCYSMLLESRSYLDLPDRRTEMNTASVCLDLKLNDNMFM